MDSQAFQIPGLSTLSKPQAVSGKVDDHNAAEAGSAAAEPLPTSFTPDLGEPSSAIPPNSSAVTGATKQADRASATPTAMDIDQPEISQPLEAASTPAVDAIDTPQSPPSLTQGLEALLGGLDPLPKETEQPPRTAEGKLPNGEQITGASDAEALSGHVQEDNEHPEWEEDSSPYDSSSDSSSSDDSDDEESDDGKELLNPEEMARILMEAGSDDEGDGKAKASGSNSQLRTKNELPEEIIPKPDVTITSEMKVEELGHIEFLVENSIVIKANTTGEYRVLDSGSVLCTADRTVIAAVADLIGSVREPRYIARFSTEDDIKTFNLTIDTKIYYPPDHAKFVFTEPLQGAHGTDASNWHDEEAGDEEMEFSDDEKEAAYRREQKAKRRERFSARGGHTGRGGSHEPSSRGGPEPSGLKYDDDDEDGPYKPLTRPPGFGQGGPPPMTTNFPSGNTGPSRARGDFRGRGRGRHNDRGGRGGQRGGSGYSLPPRSQSYQQQHSPSFNNFPPPPPQFANPAYPPPPPPQFQTPPGNQQFQPPNTQYPFPAWPQNPPPNFVPPPPPQFQQQNSNTNGAFFNPAFFTALQNQFQQQTGAANQQQNQWPQGGPR